LFTGDTIFKLSVGRCDLEGGSFDELKKNIQTKIFTLDEDIKIYPGHGEFSTVGFEKVNNKYD
jgi:hydroxyacylglutathione hydrolase